MRPLIYYINLYSRKTTLKGKKNVFNKAMLNLSVLDQQRFIKWQTANNISNENN
jgi:hypothetical protein